MYEQTPYDAYCNQMISHAFAKEARRQVHLGNTVLAIETQIAARKYADKAQAIMLTLVNH